MAFMIKLHLGMIHLKVEPDNFYLVFTIYIEIPLKSFNTQKRSKFIPIPTAGFYLALFSLYLLQNCTTIIWHFTYTFCQKTKSVPNLKRPRAMPKQLSGPEAMVLGNKIFKNFYCDHEYKNSSKQQTLFSDIKDLMHYYM